MIVFFDKFLNKNLKIYKNYLKKQSFYKKNDINKKCIF